MSCTLMANASALIAQAGTTAGSAEWSPPLPPGWSPASCPGFGRCGLLKDSCAAAPQCQAEKCEYESGYCCAERAPPRARCGRVECTAYVDALGNRVFDASGPLCWHASPLSAELFCA